jgi:hypothetical protein
MRVGEIVWRRRERVPDKQSVYLDGLKEEQDTNEVGSGGAFERGRGAMCLSQVVRQRQCRAELCRLPDSGQSSLDKAQVIHEAQSRTRTRHVSKRLPAFVLEESQSKK